MHWLKKYGWGIILGILLVAISGFLAWSLIVPEPMPNAIQMLNSDTQVMVTADPWLVFQPTGTRPTTGLIIYPGGRVDPRAYAPVAHAIAAQGYLVVIVPMPLNLAVFGANRAMSVIEAYPDIQHWVVGGHSLGGSMAALFADKNRDQIDGLVLWASYPSSSNDLSDSSIQVMSVYGTLDGLANEEKIEASHNLLPPGTTWIPIEGGNHAQFGWYGDQPGDHPATISRQEQQDKLIQSMLEFLTVVNK